MYIDTEKGLVHHEGTVYTRVLCDYDDVCYACELNDHCTICPNEFFERDRLGNFQKVLGYDSFKEEAQTEEAAFHKTNFQRTLSIKDALSQRLTLNKTSHKLSNFQRKIELL